MLIKLSQYIPKLQIKRLIKARMFNTACSFADMLLENSFEELTTLEYTQLQWQRGYHQFKNLQNFKAAAKMFTRYALPTEQLLLLFAEIFPQRYVDDL